MPEHNPEAEPHPIESEIAEPEINRKDEKASALNLVLRILDNENRLAERADQKAISLLSVLGVFMVFFVVNYKLIPVNPLSVIAMTAYVTAAFLAILHLILTIRPRIRKTIEPDLTGNLSAQCPDPAFFAGICRFATIGSYQMVLGDLLKDENRVKENYIRQIYSVAHINQLKYRYVQRAAVIVLTALGIELIIIAYLFASYINKGVVG
jgi:hypothetical protein